MHFLASPDYDFSSYPWEALVGKRSILRVEKIKFWDRVETYLSGKEILCWIQKSCFQGSRGARLEMHQKKPQKMAILGIFGYINHTKHSSICLILLMQLPLGEPHTQKNFQENPKNFSTWKMA